MEDQRIIDLFFARDEEALPLIQEQYGNALLGMAGRVLASREDAEEVVSDALPDAWQAIQPHRPLVAAPTLEGRPCCAQGLLNENLPKGR